MATSVCLILGFVSSMLSLTLIGVSIASSEWLHIRAPFFKMNVGMMRHCDVESSSYCGGMDQLHDLVSSNYIAWFQSVQALYLLHCIGAVISTCLYVLYLFQFFENKGSFKVVTAFNFLTLACGIYAVAVFGTSYRKIFHLDTGISNTITPDHPFEGDQTVFGYGFYTGVSGVCFTFLMMVFSAMEASRAADLIAHVRSRITVWNTPYTSLFVEQDAA